MRILFVGESWLGSCARSLKEAMLRHPDVCMDEVNEDLILPKARNIWLRAINRFLMPAYRQELYQKIFSRVALFKPDFVVTYKGFSIDSSAIRKIQGMGCKVINVYPDCSPHAHGLNHKQAVGTYDLVVSTKKFHPALWQSTYGYQNPCTFVPQGYDPAFHLENELPSESRFDLTLVATWRSEYGEMLKEVGKLLAGQKISVGVGGNGWNSHRSEFPANWEFVGEVQGRTYTQWLRQGKICIAPVTREIIINGEMQPGDEDTTRTYELAAAYCFFIHRRTEFAQQLYDEQTEVPMYDTPAELAAKIIYYLARPEERARMARAAHQRAVPSYSLDSRATEIVTHLAKRLTVKIGN